MANYEWIEKDGLKILHMRMASQSVAELREKLAEFQEIIRSQPEHSLLTISDAQGGHFDKEMKALIIDFVKANEPYIKCSVSVGVKGLQLVIHNGIMRSSGRQNIVLKDTFEEALQFLLEQ